MASPLTGNHKSTAWILVGVLITVVVAFVLYSFVGAIAIGIFLYYATRSIYRWVDQRTGRPNVSATLTLLTIGLPILLVLAYAAFTGVQEADRFFAATDLEYFRTALEPYVDLVSGSDDQGLLGIFRNNISRVRGFATGTLTWMLRLFVAFTLAFYLLRDDHKLARWFRRTFENQPSAVAFMERVDDDLTTIYTGNLITIGVSGLLAVVVYYGLDVVAPAGVGIQFPILLGLLTGVATLIPSVGMKLVYVPYTAYLVWQSVSGAGTPLWFPVVFFVVTAVVVDFVPDIFIRSYVSKGELNMGLILLMYVLGAVAFGWYGVFLAPVILVVFVHFARDILPTLLGSDAATG
ncbi:AI-2E family transporter [Halorubrum sp. AD140]|uniref:AI-2E family transporter n=1 Tax=Halorubrum sp. AD140 TaxID=3050073 RepID=UPI002ACC8CA7|nr:AI-2E family transporter [Halorubrum sp. AD140]MDZ5811326.1 AI-2E family transporter [Halorubrum sp. AD140]